jgi:hypothetical protein
MKIFNSFSPVTGWLMRVGVLMFALMYYSDALQVINLSSVMFYVSAAFLALSILLFAGGFYSQPAYTQWPALGLILLTGYQAFIFGRAGLDHNFVVFILLGSVLMTFLTLPVEVSVFKSKRS